MNDDSANKLKPSVGDGITRMTADYDWPPIHCQSDLVCSKMVPQQIDANQILARRKSPNSVSSNHRTHKRFEYRQKQPPSLPPLKVPPINRLLLLLTIILSSCIIVINCLDSPVKIQRHRQLSLVEGSARRDDRSGQPELGQPLDRFSDDISSSNQHYNDIVSILNETRQDYVNRTAKFERVRRTDRDESMLIARNNGQSRNSHSTGRQPSTHSYAECPPKSRIQSLLPSEYSGSPAANNNNNQRQNLLHAVCDCQADSFGWHITCSEYSSPTRSAGLSSGHMQARQHVQPESRLPNQLHPAFREPQLQRQQQQSLASGHQAVRRIHRSPVRWMGDEEIVGAKNLTSGADDQLSTDSSQSNDHEGFGDDLLPPITAKPGQEHQRRKQFVASSGSTTRFQTDASGSNNDAATNDTNRTPTTNEDGFISSSSSNSFSLLQLQQRSNSEFQGNGDARMSERLLASSSNINNDYLLSTNLFSVKYIRNRMIEIDCDQVAPHYKAAMFQGFQVNEISSFTFNNCQLPNMPFSVLLHRTKSSPAPKANANPQQPADLLTGRSGAGIPGSGTSGSQQAPLKPARQRHQNLLRKRRDPNQDDEFKLEERSSMDSGGAEEERHNKAFLLPSQQEFMRTGRGGQLGASILQSAPETFGATSARNDEPKVVTLTVNLNTVIDQRALVRLLTGLDSLEELQLNHMQLNMTNFEPDLDSNPSSSATISSDELTTAHLAQPVTLNRQTSSSSSTPQLTPSVGQQMSTPTMEGQQQVAPSASSLPPGGLAAGSGAGTSSSTTTAPGVQFLTNSTPTTAQISTRPPSPSRQSVIATTAFSGSTTTMQPITTPHSAVSVGTTTMATTTTTPTSATNKPRSSKPQTVSLKPVQVLNSARSTISLGAPRGLMIAQATGIPPTTTQSASSQQTSGLTGSAATSTSAPPTTTIIPSVSLSTVVASNQQNNNLLRQQQNSNGMPQTVARLVQPGSISVGSSQSQSISYTSSVSSAPSGQRQTNTQSSPFQPPTTSSQIPAGTGQQLSASSARMHQSPSGWFQASANTNSNALTTPVNQPAGTRLSLSADSLQHAASQTNQVDQVASTSPSPSLWAPAGSSLASHSVPATTTSVLSGSNQQSNQNVPINSPPGSNGFGIRTSVSTGPHPVSMSLYNSPSNTQNNNPSLFRTTSSQQLTADNTLHNGVGLRGLNQNTMNQFTAGGATTTNGVPRRQQTSASNKPLQTSSATPPTTISEGSAQFVAAGGRLSLPSNQGRRNQPSSTTNQLVATSVSLQRNPTLAATSREDSVDAGGAATSDAFSTADELEFENQRQRVTGNAGQRFKRYASAEINSQRLEEFELSFGELLPNLRFLKLESFIDLHSHQSRTGGERSRQQSSAGPGQRSSRSKRQYEPNDMPEKDEGLMSDSESEAISRAGGLDDTLIAEESSNSARNSVVAARSGVALALPSRRPVAGGDRAGSRNSSSSREVEPPVASPKIDTRLDIDDIPEPGETLIRSASGPDERRESTSDWSMVGGAPNWTERPPEHFMAEESLSPSAASNSNNEHDQNSPSQRLKNFSLVLVKMFSKLSKLQELHLRRNDIPYIPDNILFDSRHTLKRLSLVSNNIRLLGRSSLANLTELDTLDLSSNQLRHLNGDLFRDLISLRNLRAVRNLFRKLPSKLMPNQNRHANSSSLQQATGSRLENVDFSNNRYLSQLAPDLFAPSTRHFSNLAQIKKLNLSDCMLTDQSAGKSADSLFASLPNLVSVSLRGNQFRELLSTSGLFGKNYRLQKLDLSSNQLSVLSPNLFNTNASQLIELQLDHNLLTQIPEQFLFSLTKLRHLSISHNKLTQLNVNMFTTNVLIETINFSHNQLVTLNTKQSQNIPFGNSFDQLKSVNLAYNNLTQFQGDLTDIDWHLYAHLERLDLSHNKFSGQISMPTFTPNGKSRLSINLAFNLIKSVSVEQLMQEEQLLVSYHDERLNTDGKPQPHDANKAASVDIQLSANPISCDCMLEPLISYTRRIADASNPSLLASIFPAQKSHSDGSYPADSGYSVLHASNDQSHHDNTDGSTSGGASRQPQVFYHFIFNDLKCAEPENLNSTLLRQISTKDLLCPIKDQRLCPQKCTCNYQSAFKTAFVDCNNQNLTEVPEQLTNSANFFGFNVETPFPTSATDGTNLKTVENVDKVIIKLMNNKLRSIDQLARLFTVISSNSKSVSAAGDTGAMITNAAASSERARFARASSQSHPSSRSVSPSESDFEPFSRASALPLNSESPGFGITSPVNGKKAIMSPVIVGRTLRGANRQRTRRQSGPDESGNFPNADSVSDGNKPDESSLDGNRLDSDHHAGTTFNSVGADSEPPVPMSTAVLESAEEFRNKRYPLSCDLYLDNNLIDAIPDSFLKILDQIRSSDMQSQLSQPQAALPESMLEPPLHAKLNHLANGPDLDPLRASSSTTMSSSDVDNHSGGDSSSPFNEDGDQLSPRLVKKAKLMETIWLNQQRQAENNALSPRTPKVSVSPSLAILSLRYNNLSNISAQILYRLGKLIKSSNTKLYLGHNPFNCSNNFAAPDETKDDLKLAESTIGSAMGDQLLPISDPASGTYLESTSDDLSPSASSIMSSASSSSAVDLTGKQLVPADCPIGQLKSWISRHHLNIGDLREIYCVHMPANLADKLRLAASSMPSPLADHLSAGSGEQQNRASNMAASVGLPSRLDHDHLWTSTDGSLNSSQLSKNGFTWNGELLSSTASLFDVDIYDLCPYSNIQLDPSASGLLSVGHQQALFGVSIVFILISLCLLLMLVYFGDTQTILAFIYIHMNPIYSCLRLNESDLDGEKLYDAFVSYSSADRDIVMELIEKLEREPDNYGTGPGGRLSGKNFDSSHDTLVTEADLQPIGAGKQTNADASHGTLNRRTNSFQDLSTMSRSTSRIMMNNGDDFGGSALEVSSRNRRNANDEKERESPYRLCIHERDWLPGHLISWNIVNSVQNSRRTILILSRDFIKSVWFQVEFHTAYYQMLEDKIDRLIVIVRGELPPKNELDKNLAFLLTTKTYLTWGEKWFWERLHYALPHKSGPPPMLSVPRSKASKQLRSSTPLKEHHHRYVPKMGAKSGTNSSKANDLSVSLSTSSSSAAANRQKPLIMSSIGKDCSNLLLPVHHNHQSQAPIIGSSSSTGSSSSSSTNTNHTRSPSSFLSGSSTGNLLSPALQTTTTTNNDLLNTSSTTRLTIGPSANDNIRPPTTTLASGSQPTIQADSGRITATPSGSSLLSTIVSPNPSSGQQQEPAGTGGDVTNIMLNGLQVSSSNLSGGGDLRTSGSKLRAKKQERLQTFVDKTISNHFNLSEL